MGFKDKIKSIMNTRILPAVYKRACKHPIENGLVIMSDCHHRTCPQSMEYMREKLLSEAGDDFHLEEIYFDVKDGLLSGFKAMMHFMKRYALAEFVIICDNHLPVASCDKRPETNVIQLWHGGGALKKFGYDSEINVPKGYKGNNVFGNYDLVTVSGADAVKPFTSAMRQPAGVVCPIGLPKTDFYHDESRVENIRDLFFSENPALAGKKLVLWAPTFRGSASNPELTGIDEIKHLQMDLGEEYVIIESIHPHAKNKKPADDAMNTEKRANEFEGSSGACTGDFSSDELMCVADIMISDYSSIIFDWTYFNKPLILFVPDKEEYISANGFYLNYETIPGVQVRDYSQLKEAVLACKLGENQGSQEFYQTNMSACDGNASMRVIEWMSDKSRSIKKGEN